MDDIEFLHSDMITDSLPPLPDIPDFPDIPENVIIVPAAPLPLTSESLSFPPWDTTTTIESDTYETQGNVSYQYQPLFEMASDATTTTINVPTTTEVPLTYVTQGNDSYQYQPHFEMASNATTTTIKLPTATEAPLTYLSQANDSYQYQPHFEMASNATTTTINVLSATEAPPTYETQGNDSYQYQQHFEMASNATTTTINVLTATEAPLTYATQGNVSYQYQPHFEMASNATTTTINVPTATEAPFEPPTCSQSPWQDESGPSSPEKQKTDDTVFLTPLPVTRPLTRITRNIPIPSSDSGQNAIIKALLAGKPTPYYTRVAASRQRNFIVRASSQTPGVSASMPVPLADLPPSTPARPLHARNVLFTQRSSLRSAFVKTTTAADFIPRSSSVDTVITTHVTTTTAITTPMTAAPQLTYAISPIRVATTENTTVTKTVTTSTDPSIVLISTPSPNTRAGGATQSKTYVPVQHVYKAKPDAAAAAKKIHNLVRSKALPDTPRATVASPSSITMLGPPSLITAGSATSVQPPPSANTRAITHNYTYLEPGEIKIIEKLPPRSFPGPRTACIAQRQAAVMAAMQQQQSVFISKMKAARHAHHHAELQARRLELGYAREVRHAESLAALQEASHARLVALQEASHARLVASQEARLKAQEQALLQYKVRAALEAQSAVATSPIATQAQALPAPLQLPVTTQLQIAALGPTQTVSLAQPHGKLNVKLLTRAQAQHLANAKAQLHATSQGQTQRVVYSQAQGRPLAASRPQSESLATSHLQGQPLAASRPQNEYFTSSQLQGEPLAAPHLQSQTLATPHLQGEPLATFQQPDQPLATSKPQSHHLATSQAQLISTSQSQGQILITSQRQAQRLAKSQSQGPISVAPQRQALLTTTQSQSQLLPTSQTQSHATLPTQPNVTPPVQIKSTQANATLIAQLNAPPQKIISRGQQKFPLMHYHPTSAQLKNTTQAQLNAFTQAQIKTSQGRQQTASPTLIKMISPPQQSEAHGRLNPRPRRRLIITTGNSAPQSATNEAVAASKSINEQLPITSSASQQIGEVPSSPIQTTNTPTLSTGTTLVMPHYKTTVFKNLSAIGRAESTQLPTPTTTSGEIMVVRRSATYFPARRSFPTTTQSLTATAITTPKTTTTATTTPVIHVLRTVPRHMLASLQPGNVRARPDSEIPLFIINRNNPKSEEKTEEKTAEKSDENSE